uniref:Uncharacterized protein n=1 Tax=Megaselia scalaris TaxID=36166 RepID=T1GLM9_MEGSC
MVLKYTSIMKWGIASFGSIAQNKLANISFLFRIECLKPTNRIDILPSRSLAASYTRSYRLGETCFSNKSRFIHPLHMTYPSQSDPLSNVWKLKQLVQLIIVPDYPFTVDAYGTKDNT